MKLISACAGVALTLLAACQRPEEIAPPTPLVPKPEMAQLLAEIHLAEVRVDASRLTSDSAQALFLQYKDSLLRRQGITDSAFAKSYRYYTIHDKDLEEVYKLVLDSLEARRARYAALGDSVPETPAYRRGR